MKASIFSPLAVICALGVLYPPHSHSEIEEIEWVDEALAEEEDLLSLFEEENDTLAQQNDEPFSELLQEEESEDSLSSTENIDTDDTEEMLAEEREALPQEELLSDEAEEEEPLNAPLFVKEPPPASSPSYSLSENTSFISIGGSYTYVHLKPHSDASFHGNLGGMQALYEYRPSYGFYGALKASWRQGKTTASGASRFLVDVDAEERIGMTFNFDQKKWLWTLFSGLGFRYLNQDLKQTGAEPIRFIYNEFYCPVGFKTLYEFFSFFSWGINGTWMPQIFPTVSISPLGGARWKTTSTLGNVLLEAPLVFSTGSHHQFSLSLVPHFEYWQDGHTTAKTSTGEALGLPGNTYFFWGVDLNLGYAF